MMIETIIQTGLAMKTEICENCDKRTFEFGGLYD